MKIVLKEWKTVLLDELACVSYEWEGRENRGLSPAGKERGLSG